MDKRTAKRLRDEDTTPYTVVYRDKYETRCHVTGYASARVVLRSALKRGPAVILTASEAASLGRLPYFPASGGIA